MSCRARCTSAKPPTGGLSCREISCGCIVQRAVERAVAGWLQRHGIRLWIGPEHDAARPAKAQAGSAGRGGGACWRIGPFAGTVSGALVPTCVTLAPLFGNCRRAIGTVMEANVASTTSPGRCTPDAGARLLVPRRIGTGASPGSVERSRLMRRLRVIRRGASVPAVDIALHAGPGGLSRAARPPEGGVRTVLLVDGEPPARAAGAGDRTLRHDRRRTARGVRVEPFVLARHPRAGRTVGRLLRLQGRGWALAVHRHHRPARAHRLRLAPARRDRA